MSKYNVLGIGNSLLDHQVEIPYEFLKKYELIAGSMTLVDTPFQRKILDHIHKNFPLEKVRKNSGGCAANTLAGIANFGGTTWFIGKVGKDSEGNFYKHDLEKVGIQFHFQPGNGATGTCLALITPDAERTMLTHLGISIELGLADISVQAIEQSEIVYIEGYLWDSPSAREACKKAIQIAKEKNKKIAMTYSDAQCVARHWDDFQQVTKNDLNILFCNEKEALTATKTKNVGAALEVLKTWCDIVNITIGPRGALISSKQEGRVEEIPTWNVKLIDKLGAGDLYASGILYGLTHGKTLRESGFLGCYAATRVIQQYSARLTAPLAPDIPMAEKGPVISI